MQVKKCNGCYLIRLEIGEEVMASLSSLVRARKIKSGWIQGLGAVRDVTLGIYSLTAHKYEKRTFPDNHELVNMTGNISWFGEDLVLHIHAQLANEELESFGGHLFSAITAVTVEVALTSWKTRLDRKPDSATGLNLLSLK